MRGKVSSLLDGANCAMWDFSETCSVSELRQGLNRLRQGYLTVDWSAVTYSRLEALLTPSKQLRSLFDAFAFGLEEHARADFLDMAVAIALTCAGSFQDRLEFIFDAFCGEDARGLDRDGVRNMLACVARAATTIRLAPALDDYAIDDAVAASFRDGSEELTKTEFLSFVKNDEISLAYLETLGIVPTVQKILKQYKNREDMYQYLSLLRKARPVWTIGYQGLAGSKRARDAEVRAANVAKWLFLVDPFVTLLEGGYCLALEVRREVRLLFHVEQVVPDGGERHEGVSGTALQVLREGAPPSDPSFSDDPQMRKAKSAQVFSRMLQPGGLRTVSLLLAHGIRHTISIAIDPISYANMEVSNTQSCPTKPVPVWSAEFAAPCIRPSRTPDSLGPQAERYSCSSLLSQCSLSAGGIVASFQWRL